AATASTVTQSSSISSMRLVRARGALRALRTGPTDLAPRPGHAGGSRLACLDIELRAQIAHLRIQLLDRLDQQRDERGVGYGAFAARVSDRFGYYLLDFLCDQPEVTPLGTLRRGTFPFERNSTKSGHTLERVTERLDVPFRLRIGV